VSNSVRAMMANNIEILQIDNPPVNVLTRDLRVQLSAAIRAADADPHIDAIVLTGSGKYFISGADIKEFETGVQEPTPCDLAELVELAGKPIVAALAGPVLGIGLELAMACHYRIADERCQLGMPEITLGVVPGAGGTQRLPRLVGMEAALDILLGGKSLPAATALQLKLIHEIRDDLLPAAVAAAERLAGQPLKRTRDIAIPNSPTATFEKTLAGALTRMPGRTTPELIVTAVRAATQPFKEGLAVEADLVDRSLSQLESKALRHLFFAERETHRIRSHASRAEPRDINRIAVIGSGTMGGGIAMCFADAGMPVQLLDVNEGALGRGLSRIAANYEVSVKRGSLSAEESAARLGRIHGSTSMEDASGADLLIEAVPEDLALKRKVFQSMDLLAKPGAILATNTSTLDIDEIASVTGRPADVIGLHFFSPANVMRLLEIVRTDTTADDVVTTAFALAKKIRKIGVLSRVCYGFIGNRMMDPYAREADRAVLEGATPEDVDRALEKFGMAMGILAVFDMAGVDVAALTRRDSGDPTYYRCSSLLYQQGWLGQKTGRGFYTYERRNRRPHPEAEALFRQEAQRLGIEQRLPTAQEIQDRCFFGMVNEAALILQEGIAQRASDIDVVYTAGYGYPRFRGGPMFWADSVGLANIVRGIESLAQRFGSANWTPAPLLLELARSGKGFKDWS
jgi:3-hydroxyacyl-CoA dehydrogenase